MDIADEHLRDGCTEMAYVCTGRCVKFKVKVKVKVKVDSKNVRKIDTKICFRILLRFL